MKQTICKILLGAIIFASCDKEDKQDQTNLLIGRWKMSAYIHNGADVFNTQVLPCVTDNIVTFKTGGEVTSDEGPTKCDASDPQTITGTYTLNADKTQLVLTANGSNETCLILTLDQKTLKFKQVSNDDLITYTRQP